MDPKQFLLQPKYEIRLLRQLWAKQVLDGWVFWVYGKFLVGDCSVYTVTFGMRQEKLCLFMILEKLMVGRAGFEPATARYLWPRQARMKPTMGRPLQLLHQLN